MIDPQMFVLVDAENTRRIYAFGIDTGEEAVTFRRDPDSNRTDFGVHTDADSAYRLACRMTDGVPSLKLIRFEFSEPVGEEFIDDVPPPLVSRSPER
jgi:hypothetical protein